MTVSLGYDINNENKQYILDNHTDFIMACKGYAAPDEIDPREWYKIEMQSSMSSCVGHGLTGPLEFGYRAKMKKTVNFSRMYAYLISQKYSEIVQGGRYFGVDGGALIAGARKAAVDNGVCLEVTMPYPQGAKYSTGIPKGADEEAHIFKIGSSSVIGTTRDPYTEAKTYLSAGLGGLLVGAPWPFRISNHTVVDFRSYGSAGHAWCILGYLKDGRLVAANSHSEAFEDKGWFYLNQQGFNEMVGNSNTSVVGLSDLTVPRPRSVDWSKDSMFS